MPKGKNVLTRFREFFKSLADHEQRELWDVLVALRGEDTESSMKLKMFITARIRGELFRMEDVDVLPLGAYIAPTLEDSKYVETSASLLDFKDLFAKASPHWRGHVTKAIKVLLNHHPSRCRDLKKFERMKRW